MLASEIADVHIMRDQVSLYLGDAVASAKRSKLERLAGRLAKAEVRHG